MFCQNVGSCLQIRVHVQHMMLANSTHPVLQTLSQHQMLLLTISIIPILSIRHGK